jgi:phage gpG-like protein
MMSTRIVKLLLGTRVPTACVHKGGGSHSLRAQGRRFPQLARAWLILRDADHHREHDT